MVTVSGQVFTRYQQVMVCVQLPELAVYHVEVFVGEEISHFVDVVTLFQLNNGLKEVASPQIIDSDATFPTSVNSIKDATNDL